VNVRAIAVRVASLDDVIRSKTAANRPKDQRAAVSPPAARRDPQATRRELTALFPGSISYAAPSGGPNAS
jgi:hypothetical protein